MNFEPFSKIPRFNRPIIITEKIDGTNAQVAIQGGVRTVGEAVDLVENHRAVIVFWPPLGDGFAIWAGSRKRWITPEDDHYGFAAWVRDNAEELVKLGPGRHFGEWWGKGIQRGYGLDERRFSLFNTGRWGAGDCDDWVCEQVPCCHVVPVIQRVGRISDLFLENGLAWLKRHGSHAAPGFMDPEGIMIYHTAANQCFKVTLKNDDQPKGRAA